MFRDSRLACAFALAVLFAACGTKVTPTRTTSATSATAGAPRCEAMPPVAGGELVPQTSHHDHVLGLVFSPDGRFLATWSSDATIRIWDVGQHALVRVLRDPAARRFMTVAWTCGNKIVAVEEVRESRRALVAVVFDLESGNVISRVPTDSNVLVGAGQGPACWTHLQGDALVLRGSAAEELARVPVRTADVQAAAISADGRVVALHAYRGPHAVVDLATRSEVALEGTTDSRVAQISVSPDGSRAALLGEWGGRLPQVVDLFDTATGKRVATIAPPLDVHHVDAVQLVDETQLVALAGEAVHLYSLATRTWRWRVPVTYRTGFAVSPKGTIAITVDHQIALHRVRDGALLEALGQPIALPLRAAFRGDGSEVYVASERRISVWSTATGELVRTAPATRILDLATTATGDVVLLRGGRDDSTPCNSSTHADVRITRFRGALPDELESADGGPTRKALVIVDDAPAVAPSDAELCVPKSRSRSTFHDDAGLGVGQLITQPDRIELHRADAAPVVLEHHAIEIKGRSQRLQWTDWQSATAARRSAAVIEQSPRWSTRQFAGVWDSATGKLVGTFRLAASSLALPEELGPETARYPGLPVDDGARYGEIAAIALSGDGARLAIASGARVAVFEIDDPSRATVVTAAAEITALVWADARAGALVVGLHDGSLGVIENGTLRSSAPQVATQRPLQMLRVDAQGRRAVAVDGDGMVQLWDLVTLAPLVRLVEFEDGESLAMSPQGYYTGSYDAVRRVGWMFGAPLELVPALQIDRIARRPDWIVQRLACRAAATPLVLRRPPRIAFDGTPPTTGPAERIALRVAVTPTASEPAEVVAYVEGIERTRATVTGAATVTLDVPLDAGANAVDVVAFDAAGTSSTPLAWKIERTAAASKPRGLWVVAVGISDYPNLPQRMQLRHADDDARAIVRALRKYANGSMYAGVTANVLIDREVTPTAVDGALATLERMKPDDVAIVVFSGHGVRLPDSGRMVFATADTRPDATSFARDSVGWDMVTARLAKARGRVLVLLDACHAGAVTGKLLTPNSQLATSLLGKGRAGTVVFSASLGRQESLEGKWNGEFTRALLDALDAPATDLDGDRLLQLSELVAAVKRRVRTATRDAQEPSIAHREVLGDFALVPAATP